MPADRPGRGRRWGAIALVVLASVFFLVSILSVGSARLVLDTDRFSAAVGRSLEEPVVTDAIAEFIAGEITTALSDSGVIDRILPSELDRLVPVIDAALGSAIESRSQEFIGSDRGRELILTAVTAAHRAVLRVLENEPPEGGVVVVDDEQVSLNLVPVAVAIIDRVQSTGLFSGVDLPDLDRSMTPAEQIEALNESLGTNLESDFAQLTVYEKPKSSDQSLLSQARRGMKLVRTAVWLLLGITVLLAVLAVIVAPNRRRILLWLLGGFGLAALLAHLIVNRVVDGVPNLIEDPDARAATRAVIRSSLEALANAAENLAIIAAVLVVVLLIIGASSWRRVLEALRRLADRSPDVVRFGGLAIAAVVLLLFGLEWLPLLVAVAIAVAGFVLAAGSTAGVAPSPSLPAEGASGRHTP